MKTVTMYTAYDCDDSYFDGKTWGKEIDITDIEYQMLIEKCFEYSSCFSLVFRPSDNKIPYLLKNLHYENQIEFPEYDKYIINSVVSNKWPGTLFTGLIGVIRYYKCCKETLKMLYKFSDSIFNFNFDKFFNPEDLCFYRLDGTVLFATQIEDGECYLFPREDEDFEDVLKSIPWFKSEYPREKYDRYFNDLAVGMTKEDFLK